MKQFWWRITILLWCLYASSSHSAEVPRSFQPFTIDIDREERMLLWNWPLPEDLPRAWTTELSECPADFIDAPAGSKFYSVTMYQNGKTSTYKFYSAPDGRQGFSFGQ